MSDKLILCLIVAYAVIGAVCAFEGNWARTLYWCSAIGLQVAILLGMK